MGFILCHLLPELKKKMNYTFFYNALTQRLRGDHLHNTYYATSQINNTLVGGKITKSQRFSRLQIWLLKQRVCKNHMPSQIFLPSTDVASTPEDPIRNSALLHINKRQRGKYAKYPYSTVSKEGKEVDTPTRKTKHNSTQNSMDAVTLTKLCFGLGSIQP